MNETLLAIKDLAVKRDHDRYGVYVKGSMVDRFKHYKEATKLLIDISLSRTAASTDELVGQVIYYDQTFGPQVSAVVIAKADNEQYWVQPIGTSSKERVLIASNALMGPLE